MPPANKGNPKKGRGTKLCFLVFRISYQTLSGFKWNLFSRIGANLLKGGCLLVPSCSAPQNNHTEPVLIKSLHGLLL